jgi:hypothetical protein
MPPVASILLVASIISLYDLTYLSSSLPHLFHQLQEPSNMISNVVCPQKICRWRYIRTNGQNTLLEDCVNDEPRFCPIPNHPWPPDHEWRTYSLKWKDRDHCRLVWERGAVEHGYNVDPPSDEEFFEEHSEECK